MGEDDLKRSGGEEQTAKSSVGESAVVLIWLTRDRCTYTENRVGVEQRLMQNLTKQKCKQDQVEVWVLRFLPNSVDWTKVGRIRISRLYLTSLKV